MHLSKIINTSIVFTLFLTVGKAQPSTQKFSIGIKAAPNVTIAAYEYKEIQRHFKPQPFVGYSVGSFIKFPLKDRYAFTSEMGYTFKGRNTRFNDNWRNHARYHFLEASMALRKSFAVKLGKNLPANYFFCVGPNIAYWLKGAGRVSVDPGGSAKYDVVFSNTPDSDFSKNYYTNSNRWLFGIDLGIGGDAPLLRRQRIYAELRFTWGQTYMGKKNSISYLEILGFEDNLRANFKTLALVMTYALDFDLREAKKGKSTKDKEVKRRR